MQIVNCNDAGVRHRYEHDGGHRGGQFALELCP
jgi:hypothetical protein